METKPTDPWKGALSYFHQNLREKIAGLEMTFLRVETLQTTLETELAQIRKDYINVNNNLQKCRGILNNINLKIQEWKNFGPDLALRRGDVNAINQSMSDVPYQIFTLNANLATIETEQRSLWTQYEAHRQWEQQEQQRQQRQQRQQQRQQQEDSERIVKRNDDDDDDMEGGSRRRRRRSLPKSSRKYKKSKRVFRKKSRSTRRR